MTSRATWPIARSAPSGPRNARIDLLRDTAIAIVGSLAGGVILIGFVRSVQAGAE